MTATKGIDEAYMSEKHKVIFDARCLQDANYKYRGVGRHSSNICANPFPERYENDCIVLT